MTARTAAAALAVTLAAALAPVPAAADRHCAPALDLYYQARHAIRAAPEACNAGLDRAAGLLAEAALAARNCDCPAMQAQLEDLLKLIRDQPGNTGPSCRARAAEVLDAADDLGEEFDACL